MSDSTGASEAAPPTPSPAASETSPAPPTGEAAAAPVETAQPAEPEKKPEPAPASEQPAELRKAWAKLADKEAALLREREGLKGVSEKAQRFDQLVERAKEDPKVAFELFGEDFFVRLVHALEVEGRPAEPPKAEDRVAALERKIAEREAREQQAAEESRARESEANKQRGLKALEQLLPADQFELVHAQKAFDLVFQAQVAWLTAHPGEEIPADLAASCAAEVEKHLAAEEDERLERLAKTKRYSSRFAAPATAASAPAPKEAASAPSTLDNNLAAGSPPPPQKGAPRTRQESLDAIIAEAREQRRLARS